jgi:hypothetical protein
MRRVEFRMPSESVLCVVLVIGIVTAFCPSRALSQEEHSYEHKTSHGAYHYLYNGIMRPDTKNSSCCSNRDCAPTEARWDNVRQRWTALKYGKWVDIPPSKIVPREQVPDGLGAEPHLCAPPPSASLIEGDEVFCFIEPGGGT